MAKRYKLSDEAQAMVANLLIETHGRGRPPPESRWRAQDALVRCCVARYAKTLRPVFNGASTISWLAKLGGIRSPA